VIGAIHRGERRVLQSVVIDVDGDEAVSFPRYAPGDLAGLARETVQQQLLSPANGRHFAPVRSVKHRRRAAYRRRFS
jgi:Na+-transporting NADH:ubiquinone oxidoreductase subunit NqrA